MADDIVTRMQSAWPLPAHSTHYEFCDQSHPSCAVHTLCNEIERLRAENEQLLDEVNNLRLQVVTLSIPEDPRRG